MSRFLMYAAIWAGITVPVCLLIAAMHYLRSPFDWMAGLGLLVAIAVSGAAAAEIAGE